MIIGCGKQTFSSRLSKRFPIQENQPLILTGANRQKRFYAGIFSLSLHKVKKIPVDLYYNFSGDPIYSLQA